MRGGAEPPNLPLFPSEEFQPPVPPIWSGSQPFILRLNVLTNVRYRLRVVRATYIKC